MPISDPFNLRSPQTPAFCWLYVFACLLQPSVRVTAFRGLNDAGRLLKSMFRAAVDAAPPSICVPAHFLPRLKGRTVIIGAGKASGAMAKALEDSWAVIARGLARPATATACDGAPEVVEAAHPVPDAAAAPRHGASSIWCRATKDDLGLSSSPAAALRRWHFPPRDEPRTRR